MNGIIDQLHNNTNDFLAYRYIKKVQNMIKIKLIWMILTPFWWNSPGTLPGLGPMTSLNISFHPIPTPTGTHPDLGPFSSLGYFLPYNNSVTAITDTITREIHTCISTNKHTREILWGIRLLNMVTIDMNDTYPFFGEIVSGPSLARAQWPP